MITQAVQVTFSRPRRPRCQRCRGWLLIERWPRGHFETCLNCGGETWIPRRAIHRRRILASWGEQLGFTLGDVARITRQRRTA